MHDEQKKHVCKVCDKRFKTKKSLNEHFLSIHTNLIQNKAKSNEAAIQNTVKFAKNTHLRIQISMFIMQ